MAIFQKRIVTQQLRLKRSHDSELEKTDNSEKSESESILEEIENKKPATTLGGFNDLVDFVATILKEDINY